MSKQAMKTVQAIQSLALADLAEVTDEAICSELELAGHNPDTLAREIADHLDNIASEFMRNHVAAAKTIRKTMEVSAPRTRPPFEVIKRLVQGAFEREPTLAAAFREGTKQSDNDLLTLYDDLVALGKIRGDSGG